jgi:hypothetical protein
MNTLHHPGRRLVYKPYAKMLNYKCDYVGKEIDQVTGLYLLKEIPHCETLGGSRPSIEEIQIICRPLSDLTKPIKQANYNDGKEFVPIEELARLFYDRGQSPKYETTHFDNPRETFNHNPPTYTVNCCVENDSGRYLYYSIKQDMSMNEDRVIQKLLQWHFVLDETDWIDVNTLENNPYEI